MAAPYTGALPNAVCVVTGSFYLVMLPALLYFLIFKYIPMLNAVIAFKDYSVVKGIWGSPWAGFKHFELFFDNPVFWTLLKNTLGLSLYALVVGFPIPILLAIALNEIRDGFFKRLVQMITYAPYFISTVVMVSMIMLLLAPRLGIFNQGLQALGLEPINFLGRPNLFPTIYVWSGIWQNSGYAAIVYLAALSGVDPMLYEAARVDGASRIQKILNIDLPGIMPVAVILLILSVDIPFFILCPVGTLDFRRPPSTTLSVQWVVGGRSLKSGFPTGQRFVPALCHDQ